MSREPCFRRLGRHRSHSAADGELLPPVTSAGPTFDSELPLRVKANRLTWIPHSAFGAKLTSNRCMNLLPRHR
jgi:hypothetical protein